MGYGLSVRRIVEGAAAIALAGALFYFGNGLNPVRELMWFAPVPLLWFALRSGWGASFVVASAAMLIGNLNLWDYFTQTLGMPVPAWFAVFGTASVCFAVGVVLFRVLVLRDAMWSGLLALPAFWVTVEYVRNLTTPHGTAGSLAYSQLRFLPFLQLASITGPWGMSFVLLLFPVALAIWLHMGRKALPVVGTTIAVVAAVLVFGEFRLAMPNGQMVKVGLIASDQKISDDSVDAAGTAQLYREYARVAEQLAGEGAQVVVMPEKVGVTLAGKTASTDALFQSLADRTGATLIAGAMHVSAPLKYNRAWIYVPHAPIQSYDKEHMLPPFESNLKPGTDLVLLPHAQTWGVAICKDMDFASPSRAYGKAGAGLMLVPAWDFVVDGSWHGHIAIMRGVEEGFSIARAAKGGFLTVSDSRGRIVGEVSTGSAAFATLLVDVPAEHRWTVYQVMGDWFAWLAMAGLLGVVLRLLFPKF